MPTLLRMPAIAAGADSAILAEWQVQQDVPFEKADAIAVVETDKAAVEIEADEAGVILRFLVSSGATVDVGAPIALSGTPGEAVPDVDAALRELGLGPVAEPDTKPTDKTVRGDRVFATPLVRRLAGTAGLDLRSVPGTGPNGRIVRRDIQPLLTAASAPASTPQELTAPPIPSTPEEPVAQADRASAEGFTDVPHSRIRAAIAARLAESKRNAPHFYLRGSARVDRLLALRTDLNADAGAEGKIKVSVNDLIVKAAARAHALVPAMNVVWTEHATRQFDVVDIAVAVASRRGLVTPVVRDAAGRSISSLSRELADLAARARDGKLAQREIEGGSFCISNLGMYGTEEFSAIINPPQSAILAVGAARPEAVVQDGALAVATVMHVTLSVDHRPIDGSTAAEWMRTFVDIVENPLQILL
jgi:pyruvate dehydrogenase E2 component (dihydrolipoamide acetyltransferase)